METISRLIQTVKSSTSDLPVKDAWVGLHWTAVTSLGTGLAATNADAPCCRSKDIQWVGKLHEHSAFELVDLIHSSHPLEVSVGMAALNSLIQVNSQYVVEINARDVILQRSQNKKVALIGGFPFAEMLRKNAAVLWVLELDPQGDEYPASAAGDLLPQADVIGLTATTLMNGTFEQLYPLFPDQALVVMMGPSTPMHPVLFDFGIDILAGSQVVDPQSVYRFVGQGSTLHPVEGLRRITLAKNDHL
jgi:uncharacterized protein